MIVDVSKIDIIKCKIEWKVHNLSSLNMLMKTDQFLASNEFCNPKCPSVVWEMRVYPNTFANHATNNYSTIGRFVSIIQKGILNNKIKANYNIYYIDGFKQRINIAYSSGIFTTQTESYKYSIDFTQSFSFDNSLILYCEVEFAVANCVENIIDCAETTNTVQNSFSNMYKQGILTDCVIKIGNEKINAHRCVLANNSVVFHKMFEQKGIVESQNGEINIVDCSLECFHAMLNYFYNGEINKEILEKLAYELFAIAHKYQVKSLMDKCEYIMASKTDKTNFKLHVYYLQQYNLPILEKACIKYIVVNRMTFLDSNEWKNLKILYNDKANYLIESALKNIKSLI